MKAHTKQLLVDQEMEQSPQNQNKPPASVEVVELSDADLEVIAGAGMGTSAGPQPISTKRLTLNHNETLVSAEETVDPSSAPVEVVELTDADLEAIAGAGISFNHNETLVSAEETVNPSSTPVEVVELSDADLEAIAGAGIGTSAVNTTSVVHQQVSANVLAFNHNETIVSTEETVDSSSTPVEVEELSEADLEAIAGAGEIPPNTLIHQNHNETIVSKDETVDPSSTSTGVEELPEADLDAIAGAGSSTSASKPFSTDGLTINHNETMVIATEMMF